MENSIGGSIHRNYDLLVEHDLPIVGEVELRVDHCLLALPGTRLEDVQRRLLAPAGAGAVRAGALARCAGVEVVAVYDTAGAAKMVRDGGRRTPRRSPRAAPREVFGLAVLRESIQDFADNITRFCVIAQDAAGGPRRQQDVASSSPCTASRARCSRRWRASRCATST